MPSANFDVLTTLQYLKPTIQCTVYDNDPTQVMYAPDETADYTAEAILAVDQTKVTTWVAQQATVTQTATINQLQAQLAAIQAQLQAIQGNPNG